MWKYPHLYTACKYTTVVYYIIVYFYFRRLGAYESRVLEEREFTFCVNIKLAPVAVKWAGMPIQLPKLCLSNRKKNKMISPVSEVWGKTKLLLIELENIQMYFYLLVNHKQFTLKVKNHLLRLWNWPITDPDCLRLLELLVNISVVVSTGGMVAIVVAER